jgi:hypothetical protein
MFWDLTAYTFATPQNVKIKYLVLKQTTTPSSIPR